MAHVDRRHEVPDVRGIERPTEQSNPVSERFGIPQRHGGGVYGRPIGRALTWLVLWSLPPVRPVTARIYACPQLRISIARHRVQRRAPSLVVGASSLS